MSVDESLVAHFFFLDWFRMENGNCQVLELFLYVSGTLVLMLKYLLAQCSFDLREILSKHISSIVHQIFASM